MIIKGTIKTSQNIGTLVKKKDLTKPNYSGLIANRTLEQSLQVFSNRDRKQLNPLTPNDL
jgi:hypothetical protein